jgi:hypothetical protein
MLDGVVLLWFILTALSLAFVAWDIRSTPESPVLKWGFILVTAYTGPFGAFFYVLGCREPLPGLHERYVAARWRQTLGSTMHCVAGDGVGILAGAVIGSALRLPEPLHIALEYALGFGFGWSIFQALFMRDMAGGSFTRSLRMTFIPEFFSMNALMSAMVPIATLTMARLPGSDSPRSAAFWFVMSISLLGGAFLAYPMNWWLVANHLKHGMITVRKSGPAQPAHPESPAPMDAKAMGNMAMDHKPASMASAAKPSAVVILLVGILSIAMFAAGLAISAIFSAAPAN